LVNVDKDTGKVTGARMEQSTGSSLLDGAALEAYSKWQFKPGTATQVRLPIEFRSRPPAPARGAPQKPAPTAIVYVLLVVIGVMAGLMLSRRKRAG
jgi:TonB family protein